MKLTHLLPALCLLALISCNDTHNNEDNTTTNDTVATAAAAPANNLMVDSAKKLLTEANDYVRMGIMGEMSKEDVNNKVNPIMEQFFVIYQQMPPEDTMIVYKYRVEEINKLIDLQVEKMK